MKRIPALTLLVLLAGLAQASSLPPATRAEITALLDVLMHSECEFYRNGSWYAGPKAASHLQRKLDYLERKELITSTDSFITLAASKSSMSGENYQVRCPGKGAMPSADWFHQRLDQLRGDTGD
jgi:hypothetical protein